MAFLPSSHPIFLHAAACSSGPSSDSQLLSSLLLGRGGRDMLTAVTGRPALKAGSGKAGASSSVPKKKHQQQRVVSEAYPESEFGLNPGAASAGALFWCVEEGGRRLDAYRGCCSVLQREVKCRSVSAFFLQSAICTHAPAC